MTFEELDRTLPNGFHDAEIYTIEVDFANRSVALGIGVLTGLPGSATPEARRTGTLKVQPVYFCFFDPPDPSYRFIPDGEPLNASGVPLERGQNAKVDALLERIPSDPTAFVFFLDDWNTYLYVAGASVHFKWAAEESG